MKSRLFVFAHFWPSFFSGWVVQAQSGSAPNGRPS